MKFTSILFIIAVAGQNTHAARGSYWHPVIRTGGLAGCGPEARLIIHGKGEFMRLKPYLLFIVLTASTPINVAAEPEAPATSRQTRPHSVKCAASINVWIEVDGNGLATRDPISLESKKRIQFNLIGSSPYRGDAVLCNYSTRRRDVTTSYSVRCRQPRKERGYKNSYLCQ